MKSILGVFLFLFGVFLPYIIQSKLMALANDQVTASSLMIDAFTVVSLNTIIPIPQFLGVVLVGDDLAERLQRPWVRATVPLIMVPLAYIIINGLTPLNYSFGATDIFLWVLVMGMQYVYHGSLPLMIKSLIFVQCIFGITWLNQVPFLTAFHFGLGSLSMKVKQSALILGFAHVLTLYAVVLFSIFIVSAVVLWVFAVVNIERGSLTKQVKQAHEEVDKSRSHREVLHLVHDLKTPLTTAEGLVSLIQIMPTQPKVKEYCKAISSAIQSMSDMISEILYEDRKSWSNLKELINYVWATRFSGTHNKIKVVLEGDQEAPICINKIRVTRAIVNLIDNALEAVKNNKHPNVILSAEIRGKEVWLGVLDNGCGIPPELLETVWNMGYSTKQHPGFGLSFVRKVAEGHGGRVKLESEVGVGTTIWLILPVGE